MIHQHICRLTDGDAVAAAAFVAAGAVGKRRPPRRCVAARAAARAAPPRQRRQLDAASMRTVRTRPVPIRRQAGGRPSIRKGRASLDATVCHQTRVSRSMLLTAMAIAPLRSMIAVHEHATGTLGSLRVNKTRTKPALLRQQHSATKPTRAGQSTPMAVPYPETMTIQKR